jgi:glycosyltransferase involved in cell wall biosynthesis
LNTKPDILIFIDWFWPGYLAGGPVQSILSIVSYLNEDFNFKILTTNRDLNCAAPYREVEANKWIRSGLNCDVYYAEPESLNRATLKSIIDSTHFDKVYINSFFSKKFSIIPLQILNKYYKEKPVIFAPRGMLGEGALAIKKFKKRAFILLAKMTGLHATVTWHATSAQEEEEIKHIIHPKNKIFIISNLPKKIKPDFTKEKKNNELNACFISRISEKKNLVFALELLGLIKEAGITYNIYGPIEDQAYWEKCMDAIKKLPPNVKAIYKGSIAPKDIERAFSAEHIMILPTLNENFGHSIVESLLCGCPVIISDQTPWNDLENHNAGYAISLDNKQKFTQAILAYAKMDQQKFSEASRLAVKYISNKIDLEQIVDQYKKLFNDGIEN